MTMLACAACGQRFVSEFTEIVDWVDSDDSQYWSLVPVTAEEAAALAAPGASLAEPVVSTIARGRRILEHAHPKGTEPRSYWR